MSSQVRSRWVAILHLHAGASLAHRSRRKMNRRQHERCEGAGYYEGRILAVLALLRHCMMPPDSEQRTQDTKRRLNIAASSRQPRSQYQPRLATALMGRDAMLVTSARAA
ncbi:hypothetical protein BD410DRAFT_793750 [Rickenella mellea]|uniref:Uncharacterized protein n=1 Tax=Rickenella mellea TaxID=50990 RepID=A0A4Y7PSA2_9AGAM|nr:hypothetical protein BD410DRAFT_793750 [Rickenella mellea]